jgi:hypothetical protein
MGLSLLFPTFWYNFFFPYTLPILLHCTRIQIFCALHDIKCGALCCSYSKTCLRVALHFQSCQYSSNEKSQFDSLLEHDSVQTSTASPASSQLVRSEFPGTKRPSLNLVTQILVLPNVKNLCNSASPCTQPYVYMLPCLLRTKENFIF